MDKKDLIAFTGLALELAETAGTVLRQFWGTSYHVTEKGIPGDLVTEADKESERRILAILRKEYPSHAILAEESGQTNSHLKSDYLWIIDPIDGTTNFAHGYPVVSVSIALAFQGEPIIGVVYNPIQNEFFQATKGYGSKLNGNDIHVSSIDQLSKSLLASGFAYDRRQTKDNNYAEFFHLTNLSQGVRRPGSAALDLAYVAAGRFDGYWEKGINAWDIAAGVLLVQEAGGMVSMYDGSPLDLFAGRILASNGKIHQALSDELLYCKLQKQ